MRLYPSVPYLFNPINPTQLQTPFLSCDGQLHQDEDDLKTNKIQNWTQLQFLVQVKLVQEKLLCVSLSRLELWFKNSNLYIHSNDFIYHNYL